ncbi:cytochrome d ubiquinol oxidase subunit II [Pseudomonas sp. CAM1A]|uniref:cytochrome d ubiquinol oxidase subunit II n=1 Tax=Pseudomonas sp. CAM1A TaxID=3231717 RepID=UPI0039C687F7
MLGVDWLTVLSAGALAFSVLVYVLLDGTDLGAGMLMASNRRAQDRELTVRTLLPIWDANETWLVLGGGALLALFPMAYAILLPALYLPFLLMFMALVLRAVGLEFREHLANAWIADGAVLGGSLVATLCQGLILGTLMQGVPHDNGQYSGNGREWLGMFPLICALALVLGYLWLGACWLYWRCEGPLQRRARSQAKGLCGLTVVALGTVLALTLQLDTQYWHRLSQPWLLIAAGSASVGLLVGFARAWRCAQHWLPLSCALGMIVVAFTLMLAALFPNAIPPALTLEQAASPATQVFVLVGFALVVPVTLGYNTWGFRVFSGKVRASDRQGTTSGP